MVPGTEPQKKNKNHHLYLVLNSGFSGRGSTFFRKIFAISEGIQLLVIKKKIREVKTSSNSSRACVIQKKLDTRLFCKKAL